MAERSGFTWARRGVGVCLCVGSLACSSGSSGAGPDGGGDPASSTDGEIGCMTGGRPTDTYAPGLKKVGDQHNFTFVLLSADPAPPAEPVMNAWKLQVLDSSGKAVSDAVVTLPTSVPSLGFAPSKNPWMPLMNHGSSLATQAPTSNPDGTVSANLYFSMAGLWQVFFEAKSGTTTDTVSFYFCLP